MDHFSLIDNTVVTEGINRQSAVIITADCIIKAFTADAAEKIRIIFGKEIKVGDPIPDLLDPDEKFSLKELAGHALRGNTLRTLVQCHGAGDRDNFIELYFSPVYEDAGQATGVCISFWPIGEFFCDEIRAEHLEDKFHELFNNTADLMFISCITGEGKPGPIIEVNDTACKILGYTREELLSRTLFELWEHAGIENAEHIAEELMNGGKVSFETVFFTKGGNRIHTDARIRILEYRHEKVALTVARDITMQKLMEQKLTDKNNKLTKALKQLEQAKEQLIYSEKLACIGQLAAGVAHEINNPLGFICSNLESTRKNYEDFKEILSAYRGFAAQVPDLPAEGIIEGIRKLNVLENDKNLDYMLKDQDDMFNDIDDGLKRISEIVTGLRAFARQGRENAFEEYDLNKGIHNALLLARNNIKYHAGVKLELGEIPMIKAISSRIDQVLLNIILNASYAIKDKKMEGPGLITITTDTDGGFVRCRIEDNGIGMDKKVRGMIFYPFFTTKPPGQGTGLGLSIAYDIVVNQHGGQILVESKPMVGSCFTILLPVDRIHSEQEIFNE